MRAESLVAIRQYARTFEAQLDRARLQTAGIESFVQEEIPTNSFYRLAIGGARLRVRSSEAEEADSVLAEPTEDPLPAQTDN